MSIRATKLVLLNISERLALLLASKTILVYKDTLPLRIHLLVNTKFISQWDWTLSDAMIIDTCHSTWWIRWVYRIMLKYCVKQSWLKVMLNIERRDKGDVGNKIQFVTILFVLHFVSLFQFFVYLTLFTLTSVFRCQSEFDDRRKNICTFLVNILLIHQMTIWNPASISVIIL